MTERKPPGASFESWVDKQISDAVERGEFENLPGAGEPLRDLDKPYDEVWVTNHMRREGLPTEDLLPPSLRLRKEIERLPDTVRPLRSEQAVRSLVEELNQRILDWLRLPSGPPVRGVVPVQVDDVVERWRAERAAAREAAAAAAAQRAATEAARPARLPWWRRLVRPRTTSDG